MVQNTDGPPKRMPIDREYAWAVCVSVMVLTFCTSGMGKSLGVVLLLFQEHFQSDPTLTSLTISLISAGFYFFVFFSNALGMFIGYRTVAIGGAMMGSISLIITAFSPNIYFVVVFMGLFSGISYSSMYGPPIVVLSSYFKKKRGLATGLAVAGGSLGVLIIPLLLNFLIGYYGFQGGLLVFSGVFLHSIPAAMLLRPTNWWSRKSRIQTVDATPSCKRFVSVVKTMLDRDLLTSPVFFMLASCLVLGYMGYIGILMFIPSAAKFFFNNQMISVSLVSVIGACDFVGRMSGGYIADFRIVRFNEQMGISMMIPGVFALLAGLFPSVWLMYVAAVVIGLFSGAYSGLVTPTIIEYFGLPKVSAGFGMICFMMGFFMVPWPIALSSLFKATKTYTTVLSTTGCMSLGAGVMFFLLGVVHSKHMQKSAKKDDDDKCAPTTSDAQEMEDGDDIENVEIDTIDRSTRSIDHLPMIHMLSNSQSGELDITEV